MDSFYFTFGQSHSTTQGIQMKNGWVRVIAKTYGQARTIFCEVFAKKYMGAPDKWAFQYDENQMNKKHFPAGEIGLIDEKFNVTIQFEHHDE